MGSAPVKQGFATMLRICSLAVLLLLCAPAFCLSHSAPHVLILNSYNDGYDWSDDEMQGLRDMLCKQFDRIEILTDYLDTKKFPDKRHFAKQAELLAEKYRDTHFDVVVTLDNAALEFALRYRRELFPDTPLVFCGVNDFDPAMVAGERMVTGVAEFQDMAGTLALALKLHPATREVVVLHDYSDTGIAMRSEMLRAVPQFGGKVRFRFVKERSLAEAAQQLTVLPGDAIVLLLSYATDRKGHTFSQAEAARIVSSASPVPVYAVHASSLGQGVAGGRLMGGQVQGQKAAELVIRIIAGEKADRIPVVRANLSRPMFDDAVLRRFHMDRESLPAGAEVINVPVSSYTVHKTTFWVAMLVAALMTAALFVLYFSYERLKRLKKILHRAEARFRLLFNSTVDAIYIHDFDFKILEANQTACDRMGYSRDELLRLSLQDINAPEQVPRLPERLRIVRETGEALYESMHRTREGALVPIEVSSRLFEYLEKPAILSVVRDITQRKEVERRERTRLRILELMATGAKLQELLTCIVNFVEQESPGALCSVLLANEEGELLMHGAAPSLPAAYNEAVNGLRVGKGMGSCGTAAFLKQRVVVEDLENSPYWKGFQPARDAGLRACWSEPVLSAEGELLGTFAVYYRSCRSPSGEELALIESAAHMASLAIGRVRGEETRLKLEQRMLHMQKIEAIGQLAGGLAHDFNNLLTPIFVYTEIAKRSLSEADPNVKKLDGILLSARKAADLTRKLLTFGRKQVLTREVLDLNEVVDSILDLVRRTIRANIDIETNLTGFGANILADRGQIEQILVNLAVNAQDAIKGNGSIAIETGNVTIDEEFVRMNPGVKAGHHVLLSFSDNGCGMTEEVLNHVFEPFFTTKPAGQGTGLGLATVYGIVKQHNGYIKVVSQAGEGTTFLIYFPRAAGEPVAAKAVSAAAKKLVPGGRRATVMVVDDNETIREMAVDLLNSSGYTVLLAETGAKALRMLDKDAGPVHLLITDVVMPEMSGPELYERLVARYPLLPVLYISGYTFDIKVHNPRQHERVAFLPKPFPTEQFLSEIAKALQMNGASF